MFAVDTNSSNGNSTSCTSTAKDKHSFSNYGITFSPAPTTISGVEVRLDARVDATGGAPKSRTLVEQRRNVDSCQEHADVDHGRGDLHAGQHSWHMEPHLVKRRLLERQLPGANHQCGQHYLARFSLDWAAVQVTYQ